MNQREELLTQTAAILKAPQIKEVPHKVEGLQDELKQLQRQNDSLQAKIAAQQAQDVFSNVQKN